MLGGRSFFLTMATVEIKIEGKVRYGGTKFMKVTAVYFSPTGNTKKSVETMAAAISEQYEVLDLTVMANKNAEKEFSADDLVIFGMPVYAGRIPMVAAPRLEGLKGNQTPCIIVATYGNRHYDDALGEMEDIAKEHGFVVKGAAAVIGRHTYGEIQMNRPDADDLAACAAFAKDAAVSDGMKAMVPGNRPYKDGIPGGSYKPLTSATCVGCGVCKEGCPVGAIGDDFMVNPEVCIACFRCIRNCPVGAKNMDTEAYNTFAAGFTAKLAERRENEFFL